MARRAKATEKLLAQVNDAAPMRNKDNDGWLGDAAHQARKSDHNPNVAGVVQAQDITHDPRGGFDSYKFAEYLRTHPDKRIKYVISNKKIFAGDAGPSPWSWRPYTGSNPHDQHVHVSVADDPKLYDNEAQWDTGIGAFIPDKTAPRKTLPVLRKGAKGFYVSMVQTCLGGSIVDGDFGPMTEQAVKQFQRDHELNDDGVVGSYTWRELLRPWAEEVGLSEPIAPPPVVILPPTDKTLNEQIYDIVGKSAIAKYPWKNRGVAPIGYINGMALSFSAMLTRLQAGDSSAIEMARADTHNDDKDALSWYRSNFTAKGMSNETAGPDTLRHLFVLMLGLGMRESSGHHCEGIDASAGASSQTADTAEAGLFQMSWNAHTSSKEIDKLFDEYSSDQGACFLSAFAEEVHCSTASWNNVGSGKGRDYQELAKNCPGFAVASAAVCLRNLRKHFGPINRKEAEIVTAADTMFADVQRLVEPALAAAA
jgi:peptidoglycan hydrolase-like protein with peptidoglycan-binding domain